MKKLILLLLLFVLIVPIASIAETAIIPTKSVKLDQTKATIMRSQTLQLSATVSPEDATYRAVAWSSSDENIATVSTTGLVTPTGHGKVEITCTPEDGAGKSASCTITIPTISVKSTDIVISSPDGVKIPIDFYGQDLRASSKSKAFAHDHSIKYIYIWPKAEGTGTITLSDTQGGKQNTIALNVTIDPSAVFDTSAYPARDLGGIMRYMQDYVGQKVGITGTVLWMADYWQEGDGEMDYHYSLLFIQNTSTVHKDHGDSYTKSYLVRVPVTTTSMVSLRGFAVQICGTFQKGKSNTIDAYHSALATSQATLLQQWGFLVPEIGLSEDKNPDLNDSFYYIDADWISYMK